MRDAPLISWFREGSATDGSTTAATVHLLTSFNLHQCHAFLIACLPFCPNITKIMNSNILAPSRNYVRFVWQDFGGSTEDEDDDEDLKPYNLFSRQHR